MKVSVVGYVPKGETKAQTLKQVNKENLKRVLYHAFYLEAIESGDKKRRITLEVKVEDVQATKKRGKR